MWSRGSADQGVGAGPEMQQAGPSELRLLHQNAFVPSDAMRAPFVVGQPDSHARSSATARATAAWSAALSELTGGGPTFAVSPCVSPPELVSAAFAVSPPLVSFEELGSFALDAAEPAHASRRTELESTSEWKSR